MTSMEDSGIKWKLGAKKVKVLYAKWEVGSEYPEYRGARGILREDRRTIS